MFRRKVRSMTPRAPRDTDRRFNDGLNPPDASPPGLGLPTPRPTQPRSRRAGKRAPGCRAAVARAPAAFRSGATRRFAARHLFPRDDALVASGARMASSRASFSRRSLRVDVRASRVRRRAGPFGMVGPGGSSSSRLARRRRRARGVVVGVEWRRRLGGGRRGRLGGGAAGAHRGVLRGEARRVGPRVRAHARVREEDPDERRGAVQRPPRRRAGGEDFVTESPPRLMKNVLASWSVDQCRAWLEDDLGLELGVEHVTNKYFPKSNSSREVGTSCCARAKTRALSSDTKPASRRCCEEPTIPPIPRDLSDPSDPSRRPWWGLRLRDAPEESARSVVLAMGGLSFPRSARTARATLSRAEISATTSTSPTPRSCPSRATHPGGERLPGVSVDVALECKENAAETEPAAGGKKKKKKAKTQRRRRGSYSPTAGFSGPSGVGPLA